MSILYNKKAKCQGCVALVSAREKSGKPVMLCRLGYSVDFNVVNENAVQPKPSEKCYKPLNTDEYVQAIKLSANKTIDPAADEARPLRSKDDYMTPLEAKYYS